VGEAEATGAIVMTTLATVLERLVPVGVTSRALTVSLEVAWARSIGWVLTAVRAVSTEAGPVAVMVRGMTSIPVRV
jgi:hypothetical protein